MTYDVVAIGRVLMDIIDYVPHKFLDEYSLIQGQGNVLEVTTLREIRDRLPESRLYPGGAAGNTIAGIASLGGKAAFIGKGCSDKMGTAWKQSFIDTGVHFATELLEPDPSINKATGRCIVLVTPDADRTFALTLGVCEHLTTADIDENLVKNCKVLFVEGQMLVAECAREAVEKALDLAHEAGAKIAFNMHDLNFLEDRVKEVLPLIRKRCDILIGNEREIRSCFDLKESEDVRQILKGRDLILAMTRGGRGAIIFKGDESWVIPSENKDRIIDSTGAGDQFAAGFLFGYTKGLPLPIAGKIAAVSAAEVLHHWGGRPETNLFELVKPFLP